METLVKLVGSLFGFFSVFFGLDGNPDRYVPIGVKPVVGEKNVVPFGRTDVPNLGPDHDAKVKQAEQMYETDDLRWKWLMAIHRLRNTSTGYILDQSNKDQKFQKWGMGLTRLPS